MPDRNLIPPRNWPDAFARLPQDLPPADGWARMSASLDAHAGGSAPAAGAASDAPAARPASPLRSPGRRADTTHPARRWAIAAMLAAALPLGLWLSLHAQRSWRETGQTDPVARTTGQDTPTPRATAAVAAPDDAARTTQAGANPAPGPSSRANAPAAPTTDRTPADRAVAAVTGSPAGGTDRPQPLTAPSRATREHGATARVQDPRAQPKRDRPAVAATVPDTAIARTPPQAGAGGNTDALAALQAESAQLEALVALTRDDRVANASMALVSSELDQRLRLIDTALTQTALPDDQRLSLWRQRVASLRSLAGVESTQRWFAARGERYDDALVRVD